MSTKSESADFRIDPVEADTRAYRDEPSPEPDSLERIQLPERIGRYMVLEHLGHGGMGVVWTAYDPQLDRKVAIKLLKRSKREGMRQARFMREAQALAKLNHPNIVTIHDVGIHEGKPYMAMELVDGPTLSSWLHQPRHWREIVDVFLQAGEGLAGAHVSDITHRDFKPANVLIGEDGRVKVVDFGLAKLVTRDSHDYDARRPSELSVVPFEDPTPVEHEPDTIMKILGSDAYHKLTELGRIVGTPAYMAPEQYGVLKKFEIGPWTDQFSFGVALYEALYGEAPFQGRNLRVLYESIVSGQIREPRRDSPVPLRILRVIQRAVQFTPADRFPSMNALLDALRADPARRRRRTLAYVGGLALVGMAGVGAYEIMSSDELVPCQGAPQRIAEIWNDQTRSVVSQGLLNTQRPFASDTAQRVTERLDGYAASWAQSHTEICRATQVHGEQSGTLLDVRMACLERRRSELGALIKVLGTPTPQDDTVTRAVSMVAGLQRPQPCTSAQPSMESDLPTEPDQREQFLAIQGLIDEADALIAAGRYSEARDMAVAAGEQAKVMSFDRLRGLALLTEGRAHRYLKKPTLALERLQDGITIASTVADVNTELKLWIELVYVAGVVLDKPELTDGIEIAAHSALRRASAPKDLESKLAVNLTAVRVQQKRFEEAEAIGSNALRLALETNGARSFQYAQALNNLGAVAGERADWPVAVERLQQSYEIKKEILGPNHPKIPNIGMNLATALGQLATELGEQEQNDTIKSQINAANDEAEELCEHALAIREQNDGPQSASVASILARRGLLRLNLNKTKAAREDLERAHSYLRQSSQPQHILPRVLHTLAKLERVEKNFEMAERYLREALALQQAQYGEGHYSVGQTLNLLCRILLNSERRREGISECRRALEIFEASSSQRSDRDLLHTHRLLEDASVTLGRHREASKHRARADELKHRLNSVD